MSLFETALEITFEGYRKADGSELSADEIRAIAEHLRNTGFASRLAVEINRHHARLPDGSVYVTYSGAAAERRALDYIDEMGRSGRKAGLISNTPWGEYVRGANDLSVVAECPPSAPMAQI